MSFFTGFMDELLKVAAPPPGYLPPKTTGQHVPGRTIEQVQADNAAALKRTGKVQRFTFKEPPAKPPASQPVKPAVKPPKPAKKLDEIDNLLGKYNVK